MECATIYYEKPHYFPMHLHPDRYTFSYIIDGSANLISTGRVYKLQKGDLVVIPPYVAHQTQIESFFYYKVVRVPKLHAFIESNDKQSGIHIIQYNKLFENEFDIWFQNIKTQINSDVPEHFKQFINQPPNQLTTTKAVLKKALVHLETNFHRKIGVDELSDITHLSSSHFQRIFKLNIGISPTRYLQGLRIEKAKELITFRDSFTNIAYDTGFFDQSHFNKYFKMNVGMIPKRYAEIVKR